MPISMSVDRPSLQVPYQLIQETLEARYTASIVEVYHKGRRVALSSSPLRSPTVDSVGTYAQFPSAHAAWTPSRLIRWAEKTGSQTGRPARKIR